MPPASSQEDSVAVSVADSLDVGRTDLIEWYKWNRARSRRLFDLLDPAVYYARPISLRNPIVFYEGHLPAFSVIAFLRRGLGAPAVDARLEVVEALRTARFDESRPAMRRGEGIFTALEHEAMHQETLLYMWHRLPHAQKAAPRDLAYETAGSPPAHRTVWIPGLAGTTSSTNDVWTFQGSRSTFTA
jgi:gamma-glutamyl hercynylcysteine S-oxide synthase